MKVRAGGRKAFRFQRFGVTGAAAMLICASACSDEPPTSPIGAPGNGPAMIAPPATAGGSGGTSGGQFANAGNSTAPNISGMAGAPTTPVAGMIAPTMPPANPQAGMMGNAGMGNAGAAGMMGNAGMGNAGMGNAGAAGMVAPPTGDICERWKGARASLPMITWSGNTAGCMVGDITAEARTAALGLVNLYRSMAGLEPTMMTDEGNRLAQACALLMTANNKISHTPTDTWTCYTKEAADAAGTSSLSSGSSITSVDGYMIDPGNPTTIGHRRWILSNMLSSIGFGSSTKFSCQYQPVRRPPAGAKAWIAWPPNGEVPIQAFTSRFGGGLDQTGWTIQSDTVMLNSATVTVTVDGMPAPVTVTPLDRGYGSTYAIRFNPMGWTTAAGKTYSVKVEGTSMPIAYDVKVVSCP